MNVNQHVAYIHKSESETTCCISLQSESETTLHIFIEVKVKPHVAYNYKSESETTYYL